MNNDSLYEALRAGGYEASLVTTYNIFFPFYEQVVLPRLRVSGCRHNAVLADARQCALSIADGASAPRRAGSEYTLIPMRSAGAFHPKILFLLGRSKGALYVGSHNLTLAGFGYNREMTSLLLFNPKQDAAAVACARSVWRAVKSWVSSATDELPGAAVEAVLSLRDHAPWLEAEDTSPPDPVFLAQRSGGESLFDQLVPYLPRKVRRIVIVGAFFDSKLRLLTTLKARWPNAEMVIAVEPSSVSLPGKSLAAQEFDFRDASGLGEREGYLHAKCIFLEGDGGDDLFACGSANPSTPAWLGGDSGNDEAIVLRVGKSALRAVRELDLSEVDQLPKLSPEQLRTISQEQTWEDRSRGLRPAIVACETDTGFELERAALGGPAETCVAVALSSERMDLSAGIRESGDKLLIEADPGLKPDVVRLMLGLRGGEGVTAIVHHAGKIRELARSTQQAQLRVALQGLSAGSTDLSRLIAAVEKAIFDDEKAVASDISANVGAASRQVTGENRGPNVKPDSLAISTEDTRKSKQHRRILKGTDLGYLLDVLIHRLGLGPWSEDSTLDARGRDEEERIGQDDEDAVPNRAYASVAEPELARLCRGKVRRLVARMSRQLERACEDSTVAAACLVQLVAVLAVLRELRVVEKSDKWQDVREGLVDREHQHELLRNVLRCFFGRRLELYSRVVSTLGSERFDELARLKGLLAWLAWDCGVVLDDRLGLSEERENLEARLWNRAALLELAQILSGDEISRTEARESILKVAISNKHQAAARWLEEFGEWSDRVERAVEAVRSGRKGGAPNEIGGLAFAVAVRNPKLHVVSTIHASVIGLFDFGPESMEVQYQSRFVAAPKL
jgi:hypothetical protein